MLTDVAWAEFEQNSDREALARKHALFFRSIFMPSLAMAVSRVRAGDTKALSAFGDRLEEGLTRRIAEPPAPMHSSVQTIVLSKR